MMINATDGEKIRFTGASRDQEVFSGYDSHDVLTEGEVYTIRTATIHSFRTDIYLEEQEGRFNSVCFEKE